MTTIFTKEGRPLRRYGDDLFSESGTHVAKLKGDKAYRREGEYLGALVRNRLIYRSTDSAGVGSPFARRVGTPSAAARSAAIADWGDEAPIPD